MSTTTDAPASVVLICVGHGGITKFPAGTEYHGRPVAEWFAEQGYLCTPCRMFAQSAPGGVRHGDPYCSHIGARAVFGRSGNQRVRLFRAFADAGGPLNDYEAAEVAGMLGGSTCYWKRCGELRQRGVLRFTGFSRLTPGSDVPRETSEVTPLGHKLWTLLGL